MLDTPERMSSVSIPIEQAIEVLGLSRRTIMRRLQDGTLKGRKQKGKWLIDVTMPTMPENVPGKTQEYASGTVWTQLTQLAHERGGLAQRVAQLTQKVEELTAERDKLAHDMVLLTNELADVSQERNQLIQNIDHLKERIEELDRDRNWLRQAHEASLTLAAQAQQQQQKLLAERVESTQPPRRSWLSRLFGRDEPQTPNEGPE